MGLKLAMNFNLKSGKVGLGILDAQKFLTLSKPELRSSPKRKLYSAFVPTAPNSPTRAIARGTPKKLIIFLQIYLDKIGIFLYNVVMLNMQEILRGLTETIILGQVFHEDSYGYEINKRIFQKSAELFQLTETTLYTTFRKLEAAGFVTSYWGDGDTGARRRYYSITKQGKKFYLENVEDWKEFSSTISELFEV
ncbi:MAG: PadR family transcriptional regulator [Treponemataceae bacterium]